jgi:hypothetical protein
VCVDVFNLLHVNYMLVKTMMVAVKKQALQQVPETRECPDPMSQSTCIRDLRGRTFNLGLSFQAGSGSSSQVRELQWRTQSIMAQVPYTD